MRQATLARSLQSLRHLAEETGGFAATDRNDFKHAFARMQRETSALHLQAFEPVVRERGRDEKIDVRARRRGIRVAARQRVRGVLQLAAQVLRSRGVDASQLLDVAIVEWQPAATAPGGGVAVVVEMGLATVDDSGAVRSWGVPTSQVSILQTYAAGLTNLACDGCTSSPQVPPICVS